MNRTPPATVRKQLRKEVGFGCPVCRNPYLSWHHFDPPWNQFKHHNPDGMIALCSEHHSKADGGAFTIEQLRKFKQKDYSANIKGSFNWMRHKLLSVVGGNFYYETPIIFQIMKTPIIWFTRDDTGYFLLNINMPSKSNEPRIKMENSFWISYGEPIDLESPPSGKLLKAKYSNGDYLRIKFNEIASLDQFKKKYNDVSCHDWDITFPITTVEINVTIGDSDISLSPRATTLSETIIKNSFIRNCKVGLQLN